MPHAETLTQRQRAWFAALRAGLERDTQRTLDEWVAIARATCPETKPRARLAWFKAEHGLAQNRASLVLSAAFPAGASWARPEELAELLWASPASHALYDALRGAIMALPDVIVGQRKGFTAFSRHFQFAAARPDGDALRLGLAVPPDAASGLMPAIRASWSERLTSQTRIEAPADLDPLRLAIRRAWEAS